MADPRPVPSRSQSLAFSAYSFDPLDFPSLMRQRSSSPDSGSSSMDSRPSTPKSLDGYETILSLEREFCTNFSCCGLVLPDMHALLDHFEETHVLVIGADGVPVYPVPAAATRLCSADGATASPYAQLAPHPPAPRHPAQAPVASLVINYPQPHPPATPSAYHRPGSPFGAHAPRPDGPDAAHDAMYAGAMDAWGPFGVGVDGEMEMEMDADLSAGSSSPAPADLDLPLTPPQSDDACVPPSVFSLPRPPSTPLPPAARRPTPPAGYMPIPPLARTKSKVAAKRERRRDAREKTFRCPHQDCTKSYLNPNGLKYHLEKGTCTFAARNTAERRAA